MIKAEEIIIKGGKNKSSICDIFRYEPENIEEACLGNLYMVAELNANGDSSHLINLISSLIKREYYSQPHRGPLDSLESSLKKVNLALNELTNQGSLEWLGNLHFICTAINKEEDLFLTQSGSAQAILCREGRLTNVTKKIIPAPAKPHPAKTFQSVISGKIEPTDKLLFATPKLFEFFDMPGLNQLFDLPKIEAVSDQINKTLREQKKLPPLSALLLEIAAEEELTPASVDRKNFITPPIRLEEILN
jgi:hypothetical protein